MPPKVDMKRSMTSHRTWVNDAISRAEKFIGDGLLDECDHNVHDTSQQAENTIDELRKAIKTFVTKGAVTSPPSGNQDGNSMSRQPPKHVSTFRPDKLANSANLSEFKSWEDNFLAYMNVNASFLDSTDAKTRRTFVTSLLGDKIANAFKVDNNMKDENIPIKGASDCDKSILHWIRNYILKYQPVYIRRYHYCMLKQEKNESFADFWNKKKEKAEKAEIDTMDAEAFQIVQLITCITNKDLCIKCLEKKDPTLAELVEIGEDMDHSEAIQK